MERRVCRAQQALHLCSRFRLDDLATTSTLQEIHQGFPKTTLVVHQKQAYNACLGED